MISFIVIAVHCLKSNIAGDAVAPALC